MARWPLHGPHLLVGERLFAEVLVQLLLQDLELNVGLCQLLLEPGDLLSVLLILSPAVRGARKKARK